MTSDWIGAAARALVLAVLLAPTAGAAQDETDGAPEGYEALIEAALTEFGAGHWEEARALFRQAHASFPNARTLRGMGMASFELRDYPEALGELGAALTDDRRPL